MARRCAPLRRGRARALAHRAGVGARARRRPGRRRRALRAGRRPPLSGDRLRRGPAARAALDRERRPAGGALPDRRAAPLPDSVPSRRRRRPTTCASCAPPATGSRCWPTTARSSAAGRAPRAGCTSRDGSTASSTTVAGLIDRGEVRLSRLDDALDAVPSGGLAYLPTASYREMEAWSLPPRRGAPARPPRARPRRGAHGRPRRRAGPRRPLAELPGEVPRVQPDAQEDAWRSARCARRRGDPPAARRAIGRAQCNDAYWHGVFGGLYLPHLREAIWRQPRRGRSGAAARKAPGVRGPRLRRRRPRRALDPLRRLLRGHREPAPGAARWRSTPSSPPASNHADVLTRRREGYHELALERAAAHGGRGDGGTASIHDIEAGIRLDTRPPVDAEDRALFVERIVARDLGLEQWARGDYRPLVSWARDAAEPAVRRRGGALEVTLGLGTGERRLEKVLRVERERRPGGALPVESGSRLRRRVHNRAVGVRRAHPGRDSRRGVVAPSGRDDRQVGTGAGPDQAGESITLRWPGGLGEAGVRIGGGG